ncbi:MAG: hypothetical protein GSR86_01510 [Desulfurococcales archaeon]|nr:hypothetical protein [Desulfurococcales archaeon]
MRRCMLQGISIGILVSGVVVFALGILLYNIASDYSEVLVTLAAITSSPAFLQFTEDLIEASNSGSPLTLDPDTVSSLSPAISSLRVWLSMLDIGKLGAMSNLMIITGVAMAGLGAGGIIGFIAGRRSSASP